LIEGDIQEVLLEALIKGSLLSSRSILTRQKLSQY